MLPEELKKKLYAEAEKINAQRGLDQKTGEAEDMQAFSTGAGKIGKPCPPDVGGTMTAGVYGLNERETLMNKVYRKIREDLQMRPEMDRLRELQALMRRYPDLAHMVELMLEYKDIY